MEIVVESNEVEEVKSSWDGKETVRYAQWATLKQGFFMLMFVIRHSRREDAYAPGRYELDPTSFSTANGLLSVPRVKLKPLVLRAQASAKA